jgi:hypothetical protein
MIDGVTDQAVLGEPLARGAVQLSNSLWVIALKAVLQKFGE